MKPPPDDMFAVRRGWTWPTVMFLAGLALGFVAGVVATIVGLIVIQAAISYPG